MDFSISPKMQEILAQMREFVEQELYPLEARGAEHGFKAMVPQLREKRAKVRKLGLWCPQIPRDTAAWG